MVIHVLNKKAIAIAHQAIAKKDKTFHISRHALI